MKLLKQYRFWLSFVLAIGLFVVTFPFYHDIYISPLFTILCACFNGLSSVLFCVLLFCILKDNINADSRGIFIWFTVIQGIAHIVLAFMNWGSWLFLALSVIALLFLVASYYNDKRKNNR